MSPQPDLASKQGVPCRGGVPPLGGNELQEFLAALADGWKLIESHHLEKEFRFKNFRDALASTNRAGEMSEEQGHHPDIELAWGRVKLSV